MEKREETFSQDLRKTWWLAITFVPNTDIIMSKSCTHLMVSTARVMTTKSTASCVFVQSMLEVNLFGLSFRCRDTKSRGMRFSMFKQTIQLIRRESLVQLTPSWPSDFGDFEEIIQDGSLLFELVYFVDTRRWRL